MSNSSKAIQRRSERSRLSKHERRVAADKIKHEHGSFTRQIVENIPTEAVKQYTPPMSPARRAFQDD